jgi:hypothetical protein
MHLLPSMLLSRDYHNVDKDFFNFSGTGVFSGSDPECDK